MTRSKKSRQQCKEIRANTPSPTHSPSWQDNKIVIASASSAATLSLSILIFTSVVMPTQTASLQNELKEAEQQKKELSKAVDQKIADLSSLQKSLAEKKKELEESEASRVELNRSLREASQTNLFSTQNPYPSNFREVKIGDAIALLEKAYPKHSTIMSEDFPYVTVKNQSDIFTSVTYYYEDKDPKRKITQIVFQMEFPHELGDAFLQKKLTEALGQPKSWRKFSSWKLSNGLTIYKDNNDSFTLLRNEYAPAYWPEEAL